MAESLIDGTGSGNSAKVDKNKSLHTYTVSQTETQQGTDKGNSWNISTGNVTISGASGLLYLRNDEDVDFIIDSIAVGLGAGTVSDIPEITLIKGVSTGTLVSAADVAPIVQNRNFGSSKILKSTTHVYKGVDGSTITNGSDVALFYQGASSRLFASVDFDLTRGTSAAIKIDPKLSSGTIKCYVAIIGHLKDPDNES